MTEQLETIDVIEAVAERVAAWQPVADGHDVKLIAEVGESGADDPGAQPPWSRSAPGTSSRSSTT